MCQNIGLMPQLNVLVFYDSVFISLIFVVGFVIFLRTILPLLSFLSKYNNYLMVCLLCDVSEEAYDYDLHAHSFFFIKDCAEYFNAVYLSYYGATYMNVLFYGLYDKELGVFMSEEFTK